MADPKLYGLGVLILLASALNFVGVFTQCWLYGIEGYYTECAGIVPFYTTEVGWLAISSWLMFITVAFTVLTILIYFVAQAKVVHNGYSCGTRKWFILISSFALLIVIWTTAAMIILGINFAKYNVYLDFTLELGYSAWISVGAAVIFLGVSGLAGFIATRECCD